VKVVRLLLDVKRFVRHDEVIAEVEKVTQEIIVAAFRLYHFVGSHVDFISQFNGSYFLSNGHKTYARYLIIPLLLKINGAQD